MAIDGPTMLLLTLGIAAIAAAFLALEWRSLREPALVPWSAGFATITIGCALSTLRWADAFVLGIWTADGMLIVAHLLFLAGAARWTRRRVSPFWLATLIPWSALLVPPLSGDPVALLAMFNAGLVAILALRTAALLCLPRSAIGPRRAPWLGVVMVAHGTFYCVKTALALEPGTFAGIVAFKGAVIQASLFEGIMVEVLLALLIAMTVRRRRELDIAALAERDPLTDAFNRRGFEDRAAATLAGLTPDHRLGALMLLDIDHFKTVNDTFGHAIGDKTLVALTGILDSLLPRTAIVARLGGDEFVALLPDAPAALVDALGDAICGEFAQLNRYVHDAPVTATVSIGAALIETGGRDLPRLMAAADGALYDAKRLGGDQAKLHRAYAADDAQRHQWARHSAA